MASKKMALGRGLNMLIPDQPEKAPKSGRTEKNAQEADKEKFLKISEIEPNREQPRKVFDEDGLEELAESIRQVGVVQPLIVRKKDDYYEIIAGERRWRAARMAGLKKVPVVIRDYEEQTVLEVSLIENIQRENLNPIEEAKAYERLNKEFSLKQDEVAKRVGKSRTTITNIMRLLKLDERVQDMIQEEIISEGHARCLLGLKDKEKQYPMALKFLDLGVNVREAESLVKKENNNAPDKKEQKKAEHDFLFEEIENHMKEKLGTKVFIKNKKNNKGKIEIEYYSKEDLERIIDMIQSIQ